MSTVEHAPVRWGILGPGTIARTLTEDLLLLLDDHAVGAVGSRDAGRAASFAAEYSIAGSYGSYEDLAADASLDVIYIATPPPGHHGAARLCLEAGRAVLVEKPFTVTAAEAADLIALARQRGLFAMEAMWTRFSPLVREVAGLVRDGPCRGGRLQILIGTTTPCAPGVSSAPGNPLTSPGRLSGTRIRDRPSRACRISAPHGVK